VRTIRNIQIYCVGRMQDFSVIRQLLLCFKHEMWQGDETGTDWERVSE
jgi:hypothetical protein